MLIRAYEPCAVTPFPNPQSTSEPTWPIINALPRNQIRNSQVRLNADALYLASPLLRNRTPSAIPVFRWRTARAVELDTNAIGRLKRRLQLTTRASLCGPTICARNRVDYCV